VELLVAVCFNSELSLAEGSKSQHLHDLFKQISDVLANKKISGTQEDEAEDPASIPIYWVAKWVDYSDKYGLGYQLCDNSIGVLFNDSTRILLASNGE